ncbi:hypothetical protein Bca101_003124 [Brassica carinata]
MGVTSLVLDTDPFSPKVDDKEVHLVLRWTMHKSYYVLHMVVHAYHSNIIQDFVCVYLRSMTQYVRSDCGMTDGKEEPTIIFEDETYSAQDLHHHCRKLEMSKGPSRQKLKVASILKEQMGYLEEWSLMDRDHSVSLLGAIEALKASTLRFPVIEKAVVDILDLKHIVSLAVVHGMASSIFSR